MKEIDIQQNVPAIIRIELTDNNYIPAIPYVITGKTIFISVKEETNFDLDDTKAIITSKITAHTDPANGITEWILTAAETKQALGRYKADVRIYTDATNYVNSESFYINIIPVVTQRLI